MKSGQQKKRPKMRMLSMVLAFALAAANLLPMQTAEAAEMQTVFLNGQGGSNENSGQSSESAVSTLTRAKELLGESGGTIMVTGTLNVSWETTWSMPSGSVLKAAPGLEGPVIAVGKDGELTLNNIVIDGQKGNIISNRGYLSLKENVTLQASGSRVSAESAVYTAKDATTIKDGVLLAGVEKSDKDTAESETAAGSSTPNTETTETTAGSSSTDTGTTETTTDSSTPSTGTTETTAGSTTSNTGTTETTAGSSSADTETTETTTDSSTPSTGTTETTVQYPSTESDSWQQVTPGQSESQAVTTTPSTEAPVPGTSASQTETTITETGREEVVTEAPAGNNGTPQVTTEPETEPAQSTESADYTDQNAALKNKGGKTPGQIKPEAQNAADTTIPTEEPINNLDTFYEMVYSLQVESRADVSNVVEVTKVYDALSDDERSQVTEEAYNLLIQAQNTAGGLNHAHNSVSVSGNLPWYVRFTAEINNARDSGDDSRIIVPYDLKLWDMYRNTAYVLDQGEKVTVTMPVPDTDLSNGLTIYHYKADGTTEVLHPVINGDTMSFETSSFSPFDVAGGTLLAGMGANNGNNNSGGSTPSSTQTNNNTNNTSGNTTGNTSGSSSGNSTATGGSNSTNLKPQPAGNTLAASPNTGDGTPIAVMVMGLLISGGAIFMMLRGKRKMQ